MAPGTIGLALAAGIALTAFYKASQPRRSYYEQGMYAMSARTHRGYALASLCFAALFATAFVVPGIPAVPLLALYAVLAILYLASFVRGALGEDE